MIEEREATQDRYVVTDFLGHSVGGHEQEFVFFSEAEAVTRAKKEAEFFPGSYFYIYKATVFTRLILTPPIVKKIPGRVRPQKHGAD